MIPNKAERKVDNDDIRRLSNREKLHNTTLKQSSKRRLINKLVTIFAISCVIIAIIPLGSILIEVVRNGISVISIEFLTKPPGSFHLGNGGIAPAIQGTLIVVGLASLIGGPIGVLSGIYLSEYASSDSSSSSSSSSSGRISSKKVLFSYAVRLFNDVLAGVPSIVIGIVGYVMIVLIIGSFSVLAGAFALSIIMITIVVRVTEE